jgi:hypothetical protein
MDHPSARDTRRQGAHSRRWRMREVARSLHPVQAPASDRYQTPEWLERSFVLPLSHPEASDVPSQPVRSHDDDPTPERAIPRLDADDLPQPVTPSPATFVRPPSEDIDFARVIRRADLCRTVTRLHWVATGLAGLALVTYLLTGSVLLLGAVVVFALAAVAAFAVRVRLNRAPVPRLQR